MTPIWNWFAEGDNLDLLPRIADGAIDLVYIDPPYNTGNPFTYHDRFRPAPGEPGDRHGAWRAMIHPRLLEAHRVLHDRGALFVSIDDNEAARLRLLLDEIFGEAQFLAQIVVNLNPKGRQLGGGFATSHEYLLVYAKDASQCVLDASSADAVDPRDFPHRSADGRPFRRLPLRNTNKKFNPVTARTLHYPLYGDPGTGRVASAPFDGAHEILPVFGDGTPAVWRWSAALVDERPADLVCRRVRGRLGERLDVFQLDWLHPGRRKKLSTIWHSQEIGSTDTAVAELKQLVGHVFESPKPTGLILRVLRTMPADAVVCDFFAGSGTTGHAVAIANTEDGGRRIAISINSPEPTRPGSNAHQAGYATVAEVTRARLVAVARQSGDGPGGVLGEGLPPQVCAEPGRPE